MVVDRILLHLPAFKALEGVSEFLPNAIVDHLDGLQVHITPSAELCFARFAFGNGIVCVVVGKFDGGAPTLEALKFDFHLVSSTHGR